MAHQHTELQAHGKATARARSAGSWPAPLQHGSALLASAQHGDIDFVRGRRLRLLDETVLQDHHAVDHCEQNPGKSEWSAMS